MQYLTRCLWIALWAKPLVKMYFCIRHLLISNLGVWLLRAVALEIGLISFLLVKANGL